LVVRPELRQMVLFAKHNLLEDAPFTRMDLVVCRNALIYFQTDAQERVMRRLQYAIHGHGLLFLGRSETLGVLQPDFHTVDSAQKIYRLVRPVLTSVAVRDGFGRSTTSLRAARLHDRPNGLPRAAGASAVEAGQRALVEAYLPLSMLVTAHRQMVHAWGPTERYLRVPAGQANLDALRMLPPRLASVAGHVMQRVLREPGVHAAEPLWIELGDERVRVRVVARDVPGEDGADPCVLLSFEELPGAVDTGSRGGPGDSESERILELERELLETRLTLQASVEELESSIEELQATNEELMSSNEELQSTNEELQSVNEELYTVNAEYNAKLDQVRALHADLDGMSQATGIATLFVDHELRLVRFTPEATLMFHLRGSDVGRPIIDFKPQLDYPALIDDLHAALHSSRPIEREIKGPGTSRYLARVVGYGEPQDAARRVVLSVIDVSRLHDAERLQCLIDALPEHMAMLNGDGAITQVNAAWDAFSRGNRAADASAATGVGANYLAALARASNPEAPDLLRRLQQVLSGQAAELRITYPCHSPDEKRWFVMQVTGLPHTLSGSDRAAVVTHRDITPWVGPNGPEGASHA
jgi:two-component system CheB/CheR fusion protein